MYMRASHVQLVVTQLLLDARTLLNCGMPETPRTRDCKRQAATEGTATMHPPPQLEAGVMKLVAARHGRDRVACHHRLKADATALVGSFLQDGTAIAQVHLRPLLPTHLFVAARSRTRARATMSTSALPEQDQGQQHCARRVEQDPRHKQQHGLDWHRAIPREQQHIAGVVDVVGEDVRGEHGEDGRVSAEMIPVCWRAEVSEIVVHHVDKQQGALDQHEGDADAVKQHGLHDLRPHEGLEEHAEETERQSCAHIHAQSTSHNPGSGLSGQTLRHHNYQGMAPNSTSKARKRRAQPRRA